MANGAVANGVVANGIVANGVVANGVVANGVVANGKLVNGSANHLQNGSATLRRREAADYYVKGDSIAASELHLRKAAAAAAASD